MIVGENWVIHFDEKMLFGLTDGVPCAEPRFACKRNNKKNNKSNNKNQFLKQ